MFAEFVDYNLIPDSYADQIEAIKPGTSALVDRELRTGETWLDTLQRVLPTIVTSYQQKQLLDVQIDRAKQGLPPLDVSQYAPGVRVGVDSSAMKFLIVGGAIALAAAFIVTRRR